MTPRSMPSQLLVLPFALAALAALGCDRFTKSDAPDAAGPQPLELAPVPQAQPMAPVSAAPAPLATIAPAAHAAGAAGAPHKLPDGGTAPVVTGDAAAPPAFPTAFPTAMPSGFPTALPSGFPTALPSGFPTALPSGFPTALPGFPAPGADAGKK